MGEFEKSIALNSSLVLAGVKASCLQTYHKIDADFDSTFLKVQNELLKHNILMCILRKKHNSVLILIYRPNLLWNTINYHENKEYLLSIGYKHSDNLSDYLFELQKRIQKEAKFPHEVGIFLGYPLCDILGFINSPLDYKHVGYWKVYDNVESTKKTFSLYQIVEKLFKKQIDNNESINALLENKFIKLEEYI